MPHVYCAGPLFNNPERQEMADIEQVMKAAGFTTFLPHRDGLEYAPLEPEMIALGASPQQATETLMRAIFHLDVYQLLARADVVVANINGRVPDEGTVVEIALAWHAGKPLVLYKSDSRSLGVAGDNPMLTGLGRFRTVGAIAQLPGAVRAELLVPREDRIAKVLKLGEALVHARETVATPIEVARILLANFSELTDIR